jgi:hypothetical protein
MTRCHFAWSPRLLQCGRTTRLALRADAPDVAVDLGNFTEVDRRWSDKQGTLYLYVRAPLASADEVVHAQSGAQQASATIGVRSLDQMRQPITFRETTYPRRWPLGVASTPSTKRGQVLHDLPLSEPSAETVSFWLNFDDATLWRQLPVAELPRAHFVNCHQGCPGCGTEVFTHSGFYPWMRNHLPGNFKSECPECGLLFPDNDVLAGDFSGAHSGLDPQQSIIDDGYGYVGADGHLFLFTATYCRDQTRAFGASVGVMSAHARQLGAGPEGEEARRCLSLMLLRYAAEEVYLAAVPQFRYGPTLGTELMWQWTTTGQTDWASEPDPVAALYRMGSQRYCIDTPYITETLAIAYDTVWPMLGEDEQIVERARACGLEVGSPAGAVELVEQMLRSLLQVHLDGGASSNLPRVSEGVLVALRVLQRGDGHDALTWIYDEGPDELRVFTSNDFFPDGTPPEATGGYNNIHTNGLFALEHHLRQLKADQPGAYDEQQFPSMLADPRAARVALAPHEISMTGGAYLGFGDGGGPVQSPQDTDAFHAPLAPRALAWAAQYTADEAVARIHAAVTARQFVSQGMTILDGVGLAVLRSAGTPEHAAAGIVYGDTSGHRHQDLLDVQLWVKGQPFLSDLGYPQSWASRVRWEGHWATHNTVWATIPGVSSNLAGRGRVLRSIEMEGLQLIEIEAARWIQGQDDQNPSHWTQTDVRFRRLLALLQTDEDGVVLVDLSRVQGGDEHFRLCRGLEGELEILDATTTPRTGTLAGPDVERGDHESLPHTDHRGLAWMDEVEAVAQTDGWCGRWHSRRNDDAEMDMHVLRASGTQALTGRATATMGTPESSTYSYRTVCWRIPERTQEASNFDLVFEPRLGPTNLTSVRRIDAQHESAIGVDIRTRRGRHLQLRWSPEGDTSFAGEPSGALRIDLDDKTIVTGAPCKATITALDREVGWIEVDGLVGIGVGDRLIINPDGRGHNYRVVDCQVVDGGQRLGLDVTSILGRSRVEKLEGAQLLGRYTVFTRTGYLQGARLCADLLGDTQGIEILQAWNPDAHHTQFELRTAPTLGVTEWGWVVDYVVGDTVAWEPIQVG